MQIFFVQHMKKLLMVLYNKQRQAGFSASWANQHLSNCDRNFTGNFFSSPCVCVYMCVQ